MKKILGIIITLLFFASVTVFTLPMMQDGANADLSLTEKVTIMANAGDGGDGDSDEECPGGSCKLYYDGGGYCYACCPEGKDPECTPDGCTCS